MKRLSYKSFSFAVIGAMVCACAATVRGQSFAIQIVTDNDFAVFGGTSNNVNDLIYQNNYSWPDQLSNLSTLMFDLQPGDTTFYVLGMGGGGDENISGTINGVDMTTINVLMSSDLAPDLSGYNDSPVAGGTYDANLADVQTAFPILTWGAPTPTGPSDSVANQSPTHHGFHFDDSTAHLFSFDATEVGLTPVPEPSTRLLFAVAGVVIGLGRCRRFFSART